LYDFDLILGMDWLSRHKAQVDCFTKTMVIQGVGKKMVVFRRERRVVLNFIISVMTAKKLIRKGYSCMVVLYRELKKGSTKLTNISIVREFSNVFP